jgi:type I restriction enzyme S subunit
MSKENKFIPELRFPEFKNKGEWELTSIGDIGNFYYGKSAPKWSLSVDAPTLCVRYGELYTKFDTVISDIKSRTNIEPSNLKFSKGGEILVPRVGERPTDFAKNCCYLPFSNIAIGEMISVFETKEFPIFYTYYFRTLWREFAEVVEGQNVKNLYYINLEPIKIGKTSYAEQQKITSCLSSLDEVIAAFNQKLELLKDHKKGLMQNLFPQQGGTVPNYRFPEFENDGEWVEKTIEQVAKVTTGGKDTQNKVDDGKYPFFVRSQTVERINSYSFDGEAILTSGDGVGVGKNFHYINGKFDFHQRVYCIYDFSNDVYGQFIFMYFSQHFDQRVMRMSAKNSVDSVRKAMITEMPISLPSKKEQLKITSCLSSLDALITAVVEKIEQLQLHKKGLIQGLFPKIER